MNARRLLVAAPLLLLAGGLTIAACNRVTTTASPEGTAPRDAAAAGPAGSTVTSTATPDLVSLAPAAEREAGIVVEAARSVMRSDRSEAPGLVALNEARTARIGSLVDGIVVEMLAQPGARVRAKQVLAQLHSGVVHDSWAGYRKAKADERRLVTELRYAVEAHARAERLYADKAIALQELQRAQANRVAAEEALDMGRTELRRAEEELEHLGITNGEDPTGESGEQIPVRSPLAGVVLDRLVTQGTAVTPGMPMFVVSDLSSLWVLAEVDEARISRVRVGRSVAVRVAAYPADAFTGTVAYIGETVNPKTRRVSVRCEVPNADGRLKPEMYASVDIGESEPHPAIAVPSSAIQAIAGRTSVFVAESAGRFRVREVETGPEQDGLVEIRRGLSAGERVAIGGAFVLKSELLKSSAAPEE